MARSLLVLLCLLLPSQVAAQDRPVAFVNVNVVPMDTERVLPGQTVVVAGGLIQAFGPSETTPSPPDALLVNGRGRYLMPGLADMHAHLTHPDASYYSEDNRASLALLLANGVTTIRNMWGSPGLLALRDSVNAGLVLGPRVFTAGPFVVGRADSLRGPWDPVELAWDAAGVHGRTEDDGRAIVRYHAEAGYDFIKVHQNTPAAVYWGLVGETNEGGVPIVGHTPMGLSQVLTRGRHSSIEHYQAFAGLAERSDSPTRDSTQWYHQVWGMYAHPDEERLGLLARLVADSGIYVTPSVLVSEWYSGAQPEMLVRLADPELVRFTSRAQRASWRGYAEGFAMNYALWGVDVEAERSFAMKLVRAFDRADVRLLLGTDATPAMAAQGVAVHEELALLVEAGLSPYRALRTATVNAQQYLLELSLGTGTGTVRVGEPADLVLLGGNPLEGVANARRVVGVVTQGRWLDEAVLDSLRADVVALYRSDDER